MQIYGGKIKEKGEGYVSYKRLRNEDFFFWRDGELNDEY